ncbi:MAG: alpha-amylase/4-alpha-glucanotransferase domain-containing protein [Candidatus Ozemobacteraceae bacterium]
MNAPPPLTFALVFHAHQPWSNPDAVVADAIASAYRPVLEQLFERPNIRLSLHLSGSLIDAIIRLDPPLIERITQMVDRRQVELLGGTYHEALLPLIPAADRRGQIEALSAHIRSTFGTSPRGAWLAERLWQTSAPTDLHSTGIEFTVLDEFGFFQSGFSEEELTHPFLTEDAGDRLVIVPSSRVGPYMIPYAEISHIRHVLSERARQFPGTLWTFADDLEKLGAWPGTSERVHKDGWLNEFFDVLSDSTMPIRTATLSEALFLHPARGPAYLSTVSYPDFLRASLPPNRRHDPGIIGNPRHFLVRYPEVNLLHKRMLAASAAVHSLPNPPRSLLDLVWQSQTSCAYWHGWFGGAYSPHLRSAARASASRAETLALHRKGDSLFRSEFVDYDLCGEDEALISCRRKWLLIKPRGGIAIAWEDRETGFDRLGCMQLQMEEGVPFPSPDARIHAFEDLFLPLGSGAGNLQCGLESELARLRDVRYAVQLPIRRKKREVQMSVQPLISTPSGQTRLQLRKSFSIPDDGAEMAVHIRLCHERERDLELTYALRIPFARPPAGPPHSISFPELGLWKLKTEGMGEVSGVQEILLEAPSPAGLSIRVNRPITVSYRPLAPQLLIEGCPTSVHQGTILTFILPFRLEAGTYLDLSFIFRPSDSERPGDFSGLTDPLSQNFSHDEDLFEQEDPFPDA